MHLSTEMTIVIKLEMFIVPSMGPRTVFRNFSLQNSPKSLSKRPRKGKNLAENMKRRKLVSARARLKRHKLIRSLRPCRTNTLQLMTLVVTPKNSSEGRTVMSSRPSTSSRVALSTRFSGLSQMTNIFLGGESLAKSLVELTTASLYSVALGNQLPRRQRKRHPSRWNETELLLMHLMCSPFLKPSF